MITHTQRHTHTHTSKKFSHLQIHTRTCTHTRAHTQTSEKFSHLQIHTHTRKIKSSTDTHAHTHTCTHTQNLCNWHTFSPEHIHFFSHLRPELSQIKSGFIISLYSL